jgi:hypothetical protein
MTESRKHVLLIALGLLAAAFQLVAIRWDVAGCFVGALVAGTLIYGGERILSLESMSIWLSPLVAGFASVLGLGSGLAGRETALPPVVWLAPVLAVLPAGCPALFAAVRSNRCQICRKSVRLLLSFSCPRCHMLSCENCWEFGKCRCRLCDVNQILLLPLDEEWWQDRLGPQVRLGRCLLCLHVADGRVSQWACRACGHNHCRTCWDDLNGQCSRCRWSMPGLPDGLHDPTSQNNADDLDRTRYQGKLLVNKESRHAQVPDAVRHSTRRTEV